jgi:hypothetical protein
MSDSLGVQVQCCDGVDTNDILLSSGKWFSVALSEMTETDRVNAKPNAESPTFLVLTREIVPMNKGCGIAGIE